MARNRNALAKIISSTGEAAGLGIKIHPHLLHHACGYSLAEQGMPTRSIQTYLSHKKHSAHRPLHGGKFRPI
ncbi:tyrosine-type recombinase/integrase [Coleofasciculus sp.]|uniref:tyrosine-type recombinase/integrase n=1 Tax=Coleofasciculus sp. TaxID=3100458 RepID=UPI0039FA6914